MSKKKNKPTPPSVRQPQPSSPRRVRTAPLFHAMLGLTTLALFLTLLRAYPNSLRAIEGDSLFLTTGEFLRGVVTRRAGISFLVEDFLEQFFRTPWVGAAIYALTSAAASELIFLTMRRLGRGGNYPLALLPAPLVATLAFPFFGASVSFLFFCLFTYLYTAIRPRWGRAAYALLITPLLLLTMSWPAAALMLLAFCLQELFAGKSRLWAIFPLLALALAMAMPWIWSQWVSFVPFAQRPPLGFDAFSLKVFLAYAFTAASIMVPQLPMMRRAYVGIPLSMLGAVGAVVVVALSKDMLLEERLNKISYMADNQDWAGILEEIPYDEAVRSKALTKYTLLALSAMETLPESLFSYPINSPEQFLFRHDQRPFYVSFNRQFYENIGIWDEAYHMAFEYGVTQRENDCFKSLRNKADYLIRSGDFGGAEYYLRLLEHSLNNGAFVSERRRQMAVAKKAVRKAPSAPYRSDTFVGAYPIASEMFRLFERDKKSRKLFDYVLLSLLLNKEVGKFAIVLQHFDVYSQVPLPRAYAEALAVYAAGNPEAAHATAQYDHRMDGLYMDFARRAKANQDVSEYATTYWAYLYYRDVAPLPDYPE